MLVGTMTFAVLRVFAGARDARRNLRDGGANTTMLSAALQEAVGKLKAQEQAMSKRAAGIGPAARPDCRQPDVGAAGGRRIRQDRGAQSRRCASAGRGRRSNGRFLHRRSSPPHHRSPG
jgi:hypothetical protein